MGIHHKTTRSSFFMKFPEWQHVLSACNGSKVTANIKVTVKYKVICVLMYEYIEMKSMESDS